MLDLVEIIGRLAVAAAIGCAVGLNRDLHGKPTGIRTLGLVALSTAAMVLVVRDGGSGAEDLNAISRVMQGVITGVGFLGAGVIIRNAEGHHVHGLTTAACTWLVACLGLICGIGDWRLLGAAVIIAAVLLVIGGPIERALHARWGNDT
jgi:putative Mg2+ transporter-C (MgtC) family protein